MHRVFIYTVLSFFLWGSATADTIITITPEFSLHSDGKAVIVNAQQYCSDATFIYIDTTTSNGKAMYSWALAAHYVNKPINFQVGCTCNNNCSNSGQVPVFKMCSVLSGTLCQ